MAPKVSSLGPKLVVCLPADLLQGPTGSFLPHVLSLRGSLLCMLGTLTPSSQTCCFARLGIAGLGHLSVMAEVRESPHLLTFCQAHHQAGSEGIQSPGLTSAY